MSTLVRPQIRPECALQVLSSSDSRKQPSAFDDGRAPATVVTSLSTQPRIWWLSRHTAVALELCVDSTTDSVAQSTRKPTADVGSGASVKSAFRVSYRHKPRNQNASHPARSVSPARDLARCEQTE